MKRSIKLFAILSALVIAVMGQPQSAKAFATVSSYYTGCSTFHAAGTTDAPYVMLYVYSNTDSTELITQAFAVTGGSFDFTVTFAAQSAGEELNYEVWGSPSTDTANYAWDGESYFYLDANCQDVLSGPPIPSNYVLRTITCDVALFATPAGSPVGDARVTAGQTWYVNPTPVKGSDGKSWTQIFVSSYTDPYIPTACVG